MAQTVHNRLVGKTAMISSEVMESNDFDNMFKDGLTLGGRQKREGLSLRWYS